MNSGYVHRMKRLAISVKAGLIKSGRRYFEPVRHRWFWAAMTLFTVAMMIIETDLLF